MNQDKIENLAKLLERKFQKEERMTDGYPKAKEILALLGTGAILATALIAPPTLVLAKFLIKRKNEQKWRDWKKFNLSYLRRSVERLKRQKLVEIEEKEDKVIIKLSKNGRERILKYALEEMKIENPGRWDGKWRMVIYDVPINKKYLQQIFRDTLKNLGLLNLQKSVWLYPYNCYEPVEFLREYYNLGDNVIYAVVEKIENDKPYRDYFGL